MPRTSERFPSTARATVGSDKTKPDGRGRSSSRSRRGKADDTAGSGGGGVLLSLPPIARDPAGATKLAGTARPTPSTATPYLPRNDPQQKLYQQSFPPPLSQRSRSPPSPLSSTGVGTGRRRACEAKQPQRSSSSVASLSASRRPRDDDDDVNELTKTYLFVLQRSEDYNRRAIIRDRQRRMKTAEHPWIVLNAKAAVLHGQVQSVWDEEARWRESVLSEEECARIRLEQQRDSSHVAARQHEDIRPTCPIIGPGHRVHLDPENASGMAVELRWRGGGELLPHYFVFDEAHHVIAVGSPSEVVRGAEGVVACRKLASVTNAVPLGTGGTRSVFHLNLGALTHRAVRIGIVAFADRYGEEVGTHVQRTWLTLFDGSRGTGSLHRQLYACRSVDGGGFSSFLAASLQRRQGDIWMFAVHNEPLFGSLPPKEVGALIPTALRRDQPQFQSEHFGLSREKLIGGGLSLFETGLRRTTVLEEHAARQAIVLQRAAEHRQVVEYCEMQASMKLASSLQLAVRGEASMSRLRSPSNAGGRMSR